MTHNARYDYLYSRMSASSQEERFTGTRRQFNRDLSINSTNSFNDVSTNIRLTLRDRDRERRQY